MGVEAHRFADLHADMEDNQTSTMMGRIGQLFDKHMPRLEREHRAAMNAARHTKSHKRPITVNHR